LLIAALLVFSGIKIYRIYQGFITLHVSGVLYEAAFLLIVIKTYRTLLSSYRNKRVSIKYFLEIAIIVPIIEIILGPGSQRPEVLAIVAIFGLINLVIYIVFYEKIVKIDTEEGVTTDELK
jgi:uncharacterized membrane protein (DUF373 family)